MLFLHDVWVNWFEGEENGYNVCHFHEWRKEDTVELLDQTPSSQSAVGIISLHRKRLIRASERAARPSPSKVIRAKKS